MILLKQSKATFYLAIICLFQFSSCISPIISRYDTARTLGKGQLEVAGGYAQYEPRTQSRFQTDKYQSIGARLGYGVAENVDAKLRFEHLVIDDRFEVGVNYVELGGKIRITDPSSPVHFSTIQSLDAYFVDTPELSTQLAVSLTFTSMISYQADEIFEATLAAQTRYFIDFNEDLTNLTYNGVYEDLHNVLLEAGLDLDLNLGFSTDFNRWAVRPFVGMGIGYVEPGDVGIYKVVSWNYGVGFSYIF